ncbi:MAG: CoB--CoM heterodisulfide reductase iron-sulfur subunit B family protein [Candidatus Bipolaricaulota bacterium]|nr:CoB--CoM heterodisulfide reductase iron-sulfur subunit B family protein [Candidatus Bipolaricaulota bacterium]
MREITYYPGCSLKDTAKGFEDSALKVSKELDVNLKELSRWNCCGTVYSLTDDNLMKQLGPIRNLIRARDEGSDELYTLCSMCDNTLKRANSLIRGEEDKRDKINNFMDQERDYEGSVEVHHYLELLRDILGWDEVRDRVVDPLESLNVAPYYGCMLTRPKEIGLDDPHEPTVFDELVESLGGTPVDFPYETECCGSYNTVDNEEMVLNKAQTITAGAKKSGADVIITACPLCHFNLDRRQADLLEVAPNHKPVPVIYFTQLMAVAFGYPEVNNFDEHAIDPREALELKTKAGSKR